ncbi:hypothetical protein J6590_029262 [Homalodisca vitripennis]|nr:hypothetical protein J6590_029262 [Homalodisca vitripennis]
MNGPYSPLGGPAVSHHRSADKVPSNRRPETVKLSEKPVQYGPKHGNDHDHILADPRYWLKPTLLCEDGTRVNDGEGDRTEIFERA